MMNKGEHKITYRINPPLKIIQRKELSEYKLKCRNQEKVLQSIAILQDKGLLHLHRKADQAERDWI